MPAKMKRLAPAYSIEKCDELLQLCPEGLDRLFDISQGFAVRRQMSRPLK